MVSRTSRDFPRRSFCACIGGRCSGRVRLAAQTDCGADSQRLGVIGNVLHVSTERCFSYSFNLHFFSISLFHFIFFLHCQGCPLSIRFMWLQLGNFSFLSMAQFKPTSKLDSEYPSRQVMKQDVKFCHLRKEESGAKYAKLHRPSKKWQI